MNRIDDDDVLNQPIMKLKANDLKGPRPTKGNLNRIIIDHIRFIEARIKEADNDGKTAISYDIVGDFDVPFMDPKDMQIFVYSTIIKELHSCKYKVAFRNEPGNYTFFIKWRSELAMNELEARREIVHIASSRYKNEKKKINLKKSGLMDKNNNLIMKDVSKKTITFSDQIGSESAMRSQPGHTDRQSYVDHSNGGHSNILEIDDDNLDNLDWSSLLGTN